VHAGFDFEKLPLQLLVICECLYKRW